ncbi:MAG: hypothetical protein ACNA71_04280 [Kiritimatiellia bacterium]
MKMIPITRRGIRWMILGAALCSLAYSVQRKHTINLVSADASVAGSEERISEAALVVYATNGGVKRSREGQLARLVSAAGEKEGPQACPT